MLNHLWQSTAFAVAAWLLTVALRRNRANARYCVWLAASIKFLIPFSLLVGLGSRVEWQAPMQIVPSSVSRAMMQTGPPFPARPPLTIRSEPDWESAALTALWMMWAIGAAVNFTRWVRRWKQINSALGSARRLPFPAPVEIRSSPGTLEPGVFGIFRPVMLLPEGITEVLTREQLHAIVAHELCHVRRRDNLATAIHMAVEALFWFHPLVWWLGARLVEERERACDEEVLRLGNDAEAYAESILKVCEFYLTSPLDCLAGVSGANLRQRIQEIMRPRVVSQLNFRKKVLVGSAVLVAVGGPLAVGVLKLSAAPAAPKFEVASIRPCRSGRGDSKMGRPGGELIISPSSLDTGCFALAAEYPIAGLIQRVYARLPLGHPLPLGSALPVAGGPAWIYSDFYEIRAKPAGNVAEAIMTGPMLQALLEDRFRLKVHREQREVKVYALTVAKGGPKLETVPEGTCTRPDYSTYPRPALQPGKRYCIETGVGGRKGPNTTIKQEGITMDEFAKLLGLVLDRPVVDRSGLGGKYKFDLEFAIDQNTPGVFQGFPGPPSDDAPAASIFTVVQQQLGMKLEPVKGGRDYLVIDHVERPSEN